MTECQADFKDKLPAYPLAEDRELKILDEYS